MYMHITEINKFCCFVSKIQELRQMTPSTMPHFSFLCAKHPRREPHQLPLAVKMGWPLGWRSEEEKTSFNPKEDIWVCIVYCFCLYGNLELNFCLKMLCTLLKLCVCVNIAELRSYFSYFFINFFNKRIKEKTLDLTLSLKRQEP